jgi:two-component system, LuxR family, response regulator FixJ
MIRPAIGQMRQLAIRSDSESHPLSKAPMVAIIDDDEAVREALSDLLLVLDLPCRSFDRAEAFMAEYVPGRFDCLITDVSMPGNSGRDLLQRLRSIGSSIPVIIVVADTSPTTRLSAMTGGAHAYLTKPVSDLALFRHLQSALGQMDPSPQTVMDRTFRWLASSTKP